MDSRLQSQGFWGSTHDPGLVNIPTSFKTKPERKSMSATSPS
jgi:hypothetical protein